MADEATLSEVLARKAAVDMLIERTAGELRQALRAAAVELRPFPYFPQSTTEAIEAEPGGAAKADVGCVVVCPDGELYELTMAVDFSTETGTVDKREDLRELNLKPQDYIAYAYNALVAITRTLAERAGKA
ncbi:MAG: hypothetical protein HYY02_13550 [Chloroflexi bacterium]|nr:hypothetical protein [Chloroflexota bacterium]